MRLVFWLSKRMRKRELEVEPWWPLTNVNPTRSEIHGLTLSIADDRWKEGDYRGYGNLFIENAGVGRHSLDEMVEHAAMHLIYLHAGRSDDASKSVYAHLGAVLVAMEILCYYAQEKPHVFGRVQKTA